MEETPLDRAVEEIKARTPMGNETTAVARRDELDVTDVIAQVQKVQQVMAKVMTEGEHYGVIPGTQKPTLLKPGAEKLLLTFRLDPQYEATESYDGKHLTVVSRCTLWHITSGQRMGSGMGSCSTKESKYAYRYAARKCPTCGKEAIIKGKEEWGGGWVCFKKKDGCGAKFKDGDATIEAQETGRVPNEDLADQYNTILKMANKRSLVAAVLNVTAASDIFTQDLEDSEATREPDRPKPSGAGQHAADDPGVYAQRTGESPSGVAREPQAPEREAERLLPTPEDDERAALLARLQKAKTLSAQKRAKLKEIWLGDEHADVTKADVAALKALVEHVEQG